MIVVTENALKISNVEKKHAGLFQCFATNPMGTVTSPAELRVMPKMITAMAMDSSGEFLPEEVYQKIGFNAFLDLIGAVFFQMWRFRMVGRLLCRQ